MLAVFYLFPVPEIIVPKSSRSAFSTFCHANDRTTHNTAYMIILRAFADAGWPWADSFDIFPSARLAHVKREARLHAIAINDHLHFDGFLLRTLTQKGSASFRFVTA